MSGITLSKVILDMSIQTDLFIHSLNIFLNQCENAKVHYWNAQMKAIDLWLIEKGSRQNENSRFLFRITRSYPIIALLLCKCCLASVLRTILPPHNNAFECMTLNLNQLHKPSFASSSSFFIACFSVRVAGAVAQNWAATTSRSSITSIISLGRSPKRFHPRSSM